MLKTSVLIALVIATTAVAHAESSRESVTSDDRISMRIHGMAEGIVGVGVGAGVGVEFRYGRTSLLIDPELSAVPFCFALPLGESVFADCAVAWSVGLSVALHERVTDHWFVGPRVGARYEAMDDIAMKHESLGTTGLALLEAGYRWSPTPGWEQQISVGSGVKMGEDHDISPIAMLMITVGHDH